MTHRDLDTQPPKSRFDRYPVVAYRLESGTQSEERFYVFEIDLPNDNLGPRAFPSPRSETLARARLEELGLTRAEIEERIAWARRWMATHIVTPGNTPGLWFPPL